MKKSLLVVLTLFLALGQGFVAAAETFSRPSMAHNSLTIATGVEGCFGFSSAGDNALWGSKGSYMACIMCNLAPGGLTQVNIVAASAEEIPDVVQSEVTRLQRRMEELGRDRNLDRRR
jgi:hypothetical protein